MPVDSGSKLKTVYVDTHVRTTGASRTVVNRRDRRGNTVYVYRTVYHHYTAPASSAANPGGYGGTGGGFGGGLSAAPTQGNVTAHAWVIARQRLLRALGFHITVDGVWGARSQAAWNRYIGQGGATSSTAQALREHKQFLNLKRDVAVREAQASAQLHATDAIENFRLRSARQKANLNANAAGVRERALVKSLHRQQLDTARRRAIQEHETATGLRLARLGTILNQNPEAAKGLRLDDVVLLISHGLDVNTQFGAATVQRYLKANGHPTLKVDGSFGPETAAALVHDYKVAVERERRQQIRTTVNAFYDSGILQAGAQAPAWWPLAGRAPNAQALQRLLERGGFTAAIIWAGLVRELRNPHNEFLIWRAQEIRKTAQSLFGQFGSGIGNVSVLERLGVRTPTPLLAAAVYQRQLGLIAPDEQKALELRWSAMFSATDIKDFERRVLSFERAEEIAYQKALADQGDQPWYLDALDQAMRPGRWVRGTTVAAYFKLEDRIGDYVDDPWGSFKEDVTHPAKNPFSEESSRERNFYLDMAQEWIDGLPWGARFAFEALVDPVNFVPVGGIGRGLMRGMSLTGRELATFGHAVQTADGLAGEFGVVIAKTGRGIELAGENNLFLKQIAKGSIRAGIDASPSLQAAEFWARKLARIKGETAALAGEMAQIAIRSGFRTTGKKFPGLRYADNVLPKNSRTLKLLREAGDATLRDVPTYLPRLVSHVLNNGNPLSMYLTHNGGLLSTYGQALQGFVHETIRVSEAWRLAHKMATDAKARAFDLGASPAEARNAYFAEFDRVKQGIGVYGQGTGDPAMLEVLDGSVKALSDRFDNVVLPALQRLVVEAAEENGLELWDEAGLWLGRDAVSERAFRDLIASSFDPENLVEVANPMYAQMLEPQIADRMIEREIGQRQRSLLGWQEREVAMGRGMSEDELQKRLAAIRTEVESAWVTADTGSVKLGFNDEEMLKLQKELGIEGVPVHMTTVPDSEFQSRGRFLWRVRDGAVQNQEIEILVKESWFEEASRAQAAKLGRRISQTVAHEHRHAWQWANWGPHRFADDFFSRPYSERLQEIDAAGFAKVNSARLRKLIEVERVPSGMKMDTRQTLKVSPLRARHLDQAWGHPSPFEGSPTALAGLAQHGENLFQDPLYQELFDHTWALGQSLKEAPQSSPLLPGDPNIAPGYWPEEKRIPPTSGPMKDFRHTIFKNEVAVGRAYQETLSRALLNEAAVMQALAHAESRFYRYTYNSIQFGLSTWIFLTLPFRPGWVVRNVVDNFAKTMVAGVRDPRAYFPAEFATKNTKSIFEAGVSDILFAARTFDGIFKTRVAHELEALLESFWNHTEDVLERIFAMHGIPVPRHILEGKRHLPHKLPPRPRLNTRAARKQIDAAIDADDFSKLEDIKELRPRTAAQIEADRGLIDRFQRKVWELMATKPENYAKKLLYRETYQRVRAAKLAEGFARDEAEDIAFKEAWAKVDAVLFDYSQESVLEENLKFIFPFAQFWRKNTKFWVTSAATKPWLPLGLAKFEETMQQENADLPDWMQRYLRLDDVTDAVAKVPGLGWLADYARSVGIENLNTDPINFFSFAPLWRSFKQSNPLLPSEQAGWKFVSGFVDGLNDWGLSLNPLVRKPFEAAGVLNYRAWQSVFPQTSLAVAVSRKYLDERWAGKIANWEQIFTLFQGLPPSQAVAEAFNEWVQKEMANQAARGERISRSKAESVVEDYLLIQTLIGYFSGAYARRITQEDVYLYKLSEQALEDQGFYEQMTGKEKELLKLWRLRKVDRVAFDRYVDAIPMIRGFYGQADFEAREHFKLKHPEVIPFVDPAWRGRQWTSNYVATAALLIDTEAVFKLSKLADEVGIDFETRKIANAYLVTPELEAFWAQNDTTRTIRDKMLKGLWFRHLGGLNEQFHAFPATDFDARNGFLEAHPELQDFWNSNNSASDDYAQIINATNADLREKYFEFVDAGDWSSANAFLTQFPFIFDKVKNGRFQEDNTTGRGPHFTGHGMTQHARDYLAAKQWLDYYFGLPQEQRTAWLEGGSSGAAIVLAYFKKYSDSGRVERGFNNFSSLGFVQTHNAELAMRLKFWAIYWNLPPGKRVEFVQKHAAQYGIFVYGILSANAMAKREAEWMRMAYLSGLTPRAAHFLYVKPLLDFFFTLKNRDQKQLFLRANPELQEYFDLFAKKESITGNPKLDKLIERYFSFAPDSPQRSKMLREHPELQAYFDSKSTPEEAAMHRLLTVYFSLDGLERKNFLLKHPEIQEYFDKRARERDNQRVQLEAFDEADPRFSPFLSRAREDIIPSGDRMREALFRGRESVSGIGQRRERRPA